MLTSRRNFKKQKLQPGDYCPHCVHESESDEQGFLEIVHDEWDEDWNHLQCNYCCGTYFYFYFYDPSENKNWFKEGF